MKLEEAFYYFKNNTITQCDNCKCMQKRSLLIETDACSTVHLYMGSCCKKLVCKEGCKMYCPSCKRLIVFNSEIENYILPQRCFDCNIIIEMSNQCWNGIRPWEYCKYNNCNCGIIDMYKLYMKNL